MYNNLINHDSIALEVASWVFVLLVISFLFFQFYYILLLGIALYKAFLRHKAFLMEKDFKPIHYSTLPHLAIIIPVYNKGRHFLKSIEHLLNVKEININIFVVNDGSTDGSGDYLIDAYQMVEIPKIYEDQIKTKEVKQLYVGKKHKNLFFIDKENGGKFDAVNAGINAVEDPFFIVLDADTYIDTQGVVHLIPTLFNNKKVVAMGVQIRPKNGVLITQNKVNTHKTPKNFITGAQTLEYIRSFLVRLGWDSLGGNPVIAGAFSLFRTKAVRYAGGFFNTVAEDMEIIVRLKRLFKKNKQEFSIFYSSDTLAWTLIPEKWRELILQRERWHFGTCEVLWFHKRLIHNLKYGLFGGLVMPFYFYGEAIEPLLELLGMILVAFSWVLGAADFKVAIAMTLILILGYTIFSISSLNNEDLGLRRSKGSKTNFKLTLIAFVESFGYRQILLYASLKGIFSFLIKFPEVLKKSKEMKKILKDPNKDQLNDVFK